jgi:hypothetical protein
MFFYIMNSWGKKLSHHKKKSGKIVTAGVDKLWIDDLSKNIIKLSTPNESCI